MAEALSPQTGELSSQGDPHLSGAPIPDVNLVPKIIDPISGLTPTDPLAKRIASLSDSQLDEITDQSSNTGLTQLRSKPHSRAISAGASLAAGVTAFTTAAIVENINTSPANASGMLKTAAGSGTICTPEFIAEHPNALAGGDSSVGGEPTSIKSDSLAQTHGSDTASIGNPNDPEKEYSSENIIVRFTDPNGKELVLSIEPCQPNAEPVESAWPYESPDEAGKAWRERKIKVTDEMRYDDNGFIQPFDTRNIGSNPKEVPIAQYTYLYLGQKSKDNKNYILVGFEDKKGNPYTSWIRVGANKDGFSEIYETEEHEIFSFGQKMTTSDSVVSELDGYEGKPMYTLIRHYETTGLSDEENIILNNHLKENFDFFKFVKNVTRKHSIKKLGEKLPPYINCDFEDADLSEAPIADVFAKKP